MFAGSSSKFPTEGVTPSDSHKKDNSNAIKKCIKREMYLKGKTRADREKWQMTLVLQAENCYILNNIPDIYDPYWTLDLGSHRSAWSNGACPVLQLPFHLCWKYWALNVRCWICVKYVAKNFNALAAGAKWKWMGVAWENGKAGKWESGKMVRWQMIMERNKFQRWLSDCSCEESHAKIVESSRSFTPTGRE